MRGIVRKSLSKVTEIGGDSVAFPVIGTGNLAFPSQEASRILLDEAVAFCQANPLSSLKDIRFVLFHGDQGVIDAFQQEGNSLKEKYRKVVEVVQGNWLFQLSVLKDSEKTGYTCNYNAASYSKYIIDEGGKKFKGMIFCLLTKIHVKSNLIFFFVKLALKLQQKDS